MKIIATLMKWRNIIDSYSHHANTQKPNNLQMNKQINLQNYRHADIKQGLNCCASYQSLLSSENNTDSAMFTRNKTFHAI